MQLKAFDQFFGSKHSLFPADREVAVERISQLIQSQVVLIAEKEHASILPAVVLDRERLGFIAGAIGTHPYNSEIVVLSEQFWWVDPEHRGSSAGARLLEAFLNFGREHADWIVMTLEAKLCSPAE